MLFFILVLGFSFFSPKIMFEILDFTFSSFILGNLLPLVCPLDIPFQEIFCNFSFYLLNKGSIILYYSYIVKIILFYTMSVLGDKRVSQVAKWYLFWWQGQDWRCYCDIICYEWYSECSHRYMTLFISIHLWRGAYMYYFNTLESYNL